MDTRPVTTFDWELDRAMRDQKLGELLLLYHRAGECNLEQFGVVQHFVNWVHHLKVLGYGAVEGRERTEEAIGKSGLDSP